MLSQVQRQYDAVKGFEDRAAIRSPNLLNTDVESDSLVADCRIN